MKTRENRLRQIKYTLAPFVVLPLLVTLTTGSLYQLADLAGLEDQFKWLLSIHKGNFGIVRLGFIYPFLNALGLLIMTLAGITLWFKARARRKQSQSNH